MISSGFLIAWTPYVIVSFWSMFHSLEQDHMAPVITLLPCLFAKSSTVYNPFIYFIFQRTSSHKLLRLQRLVFCCSHQASSSAERAELESKIVKGSDCSIFKDGSDKVRVGLMGAPGRHPGSEVTTVSWDYTWWSLCSYLTPLFNLSWRDYIDILGNTLTCFLAKS